MKLNVKRTFPSLFAASLIFAGLSGCSSKATSNPSTNNTEAQQEIKIGGSSSSYAAIKILTDAYSNKQKNTKATFLPPSQSEVAIAGVKDGLIDLGSISKQLKPEEAGDALEYRQVAKDALLVATHPSVKNITNLTTDNLKAIYSGKAKNWQEFGGINAKIVVLDRPEDESAKKLLRKHYLGKDLKNSSLSVVLRKESDLIAAIQSTPNSIGAFSLASAISNKLPVNRLSINGVEATSENIKSGKYKMIRDIGVVSKKVAKSHVKALVDFALTPEGAAVLNQSGFVAINQK
jgi:phosphate transport system substrate-binding protein